MKFMILILLYSFCIKTASSQKFEINANGFFINSQKITRATTRADLRTLLGNPEQMKIGINTIAGFYHTLGVKIYFHAVDSFASSVSLYFVILSGKFAVKSTFSGSILVFGNEITNATSLSDVLKIKELNVDTKTGLPIANVADFRILFLQPNEMRTLQSIAFLLSKEGE